MTNDLALAKPGDILFVSSRWNKRLEKVKRVTPTGRVILENGDQFDPRGWKRGESGWDHTQARLATEDDIAGIYRAGLVDKLRHFAWDKLSAIDLKAVGEIVKNSNVK